MPGIVGLITKMPRVWAEPRLLRMVDTLRHESFYKTGAWIDEPSGIYAGWSVQENSFSDGMPVRNEKGNAVLLFSGEDYSDSSVKRGLKQQGHDFESESASYLVHLFEQDPSFPKSLNGRFHGLVTDTITGAAKLFNDRYGMHRLYYHESSEAFYFAVEAKAILAVCPECKAADMRGLAEFVTCGCVMEDRTFFSGIKLLPPGSSWTFRQGTLEGKGKYFDSQEWEQQSPLDSESYHREIRNAFSANLPHYFNGRQPIGMSLTGGLDTRMVLAWQKPAPRSLPCYTYGGSYRECQDVIVARNVAKACGQSHAVIPVEKDFLSQFPHYAERSVYLTDGCVDVTRAADLYVSERARRIAPVRMTGLYGDEILRHARAFKPVPPVPGLFNWSFLSQVSGARNTYSEILKGNPTSFAVFRQAPWYHHGILSLEETQLTVRTPYLDNEFVRTVFRGPQSATTNNDLRVRLIGEGSTELQRMRTDRGFAGTGGISGFAARNLLEFTFKAEYAYDYGMPQWVSRVDHLFSPLKLERLFLGRHKFSHYRVWYRDILASYVREMLLDECTLTRPYLERSGVEAIVKGHLTGGLNYTTEIHRLLSLELLHRLFLDGR